MAQVLHLAAHPPGDLEGSPSPWPGDPFLEPCPSLLPLLPLYKGAPSPYLPVEPNSRAAKRPAILYLLLYLRGPPEPSCAGGMQSSGLGRKVTCSVYQ
jgi:hypothetical protein